MAKDSVRSINTSLTVSNPLPFLVEQNIIIIRCVNLTINFALFRPLKLNFLFHRPGRLVKSKIGLGDNLDI